MANATHGHSPISGQSITYMAWGNMLGRCNNPSKERYPRYGGRGIRVCSRWHVFANFLADMGVKPIGMMLERKNNDGNYCKKNCKWAPLSEQANNRSNNRPITWKGKTLNEIQWARKIGASPVAFRMRIHRGWPLQKVFEQPYRNRNV